ncbi:MAG: DUF1836 domain-containing protein [Lachnospiraceae bacterium]|nr:DUF1836 domain-containing protein [Lachnospiraceae bacterium]
MKTNEERLKALLSKLDDLTYIKPEEIPNIQLYMDQVTTFMEAHLSHTKRYPEDKVLTKTMINNYAKNNLLPAPIKKKYSKEHMLMLIFIYYFKNVLSFNDIQQIFKPITSQYFTENPSEASSYTLEDIYREVFSLEKAQMENLKQDVTAKFQMAKNTFQDCDAATEDQEYLRLFAFICQLSFDVYLKTQMIESLTDQLRSEEPPGTDKRRK